ncbi:Rpn family recombination-promoting nuclease/putative transposase [Methylomagnum sp.]
MGDKDIISKRILKNLVRDFAIHLFGLPVTEVELLETEHQRVEGRRADLVAKVALPDGETFLLHIEIQNGNDKLMHGRMLRYLSDIILEHPGPPVRQYLVYIGRERLTMVDGFDMPDFSYRYRIIDLHAVDCGELLRRDSPDAWVLAVLCDFGTRLPRDVIHTILARLKQRFGDHPPRLREYVDMLDILAGNRDLNIDIREELKMLTIDVEKLATYQLGMEKGMARGMEQGMERGMERGMEQGARRQAVETATKMLGAGFKPDQVAFMTGLALAEVEALANQKPAHNG